jgi:hypothetical protein
MRLPRVQFTIRWFMTWIAVFAAAVTLLVAADHEGRASGCGAPLFFVMPILLALAVGYVIARIVIFAIRHPS